jgi:hypothetical protein
MSSDNVDPPQVEELPDEPTSSSTPEPSSFSDIRQAKEFVLSKCEAKNIMCMLNYQIVDGSIIEFVDSDKSLVVAAGRLSYSNRLLVNDTTGEMFVPVSVSGLSFARSTISFS